ncbi:hypothetical protein GCM10007276_12990 [Agaricicola taiwanensis]|uniref:DUF1491 family protein n=1 Tax=Agaricicola taiwanensis TaxID=591372 RepID=A0A8J2YGM8_9RHOB|nr:DUF1491 family protein [Agaricicola taiwanensis]GGE36921.1 hypothetical protein GCM10007276_12990 [Agaricicola taiwanensis]
MSSRLRSDFWVSAYIRSCHLRGAYGVVRRRGAAEAGAIFIKIDRLDGTFDLYAPAPQSAIDDDALDRQFVRVGPARADGASIEQRLAREADFDPDVWILEVEDKAGDPGLQTVA